MNDRHLVVMDYNAVRNAFNREFKETKKLIRNGESHLDNLAEGFVEADRVLQKLSTDVVCCKECKHFGGVIYGQTCRLHSFGNTRVCMGEDDFCSHGERRYD